MTTSMLLAVFGLLRLAAGDETSSGYSIIETVSTTVIVDWLFTSPGLASPTPELNPITIVSTIPSATYTPLTSSSEASYPDPGEPSTPTSELSVVTPDTSEYCEYLTVTSVAIVTPTTLVTTKAITITTMTTEAYSTIGAEITNGIDTSSLSYTQECKGKHDPVCRNNWGGLTAAQPQPEETPLTAVTSWKRNIEARDEEVDGVLGFIGQEGHVGRSDGSRSQGWSVAAVVAALAALI